MERKFLHQGDVQLITSNKPSGLKSVAKKPLALGEKSGHQHVITGDYELLENEVGELFVSVGNAGAVLQHIHESNFTGNWNSTTEMPAADHKSITLEPDSFFKVGIHRKYEPFAKVWESVAD